MKKATYIARRVYALIWRVYRKSNKMIIHTLLPFLTKLKPGEMKLERLGSDYGGWTVPVNLLNERSICYCVGVGVDASFDFSLVNQFKNKVYSFDPTPKAINYMEREQYDRERLHFLPIGVWDENTQLRFYSPANEEETSHSVFDLHGTGKYFTAECRKLSTIMQDLGHDHIDLLKLDIEGSWRNVIQNIVDENIDIFILCVELDSPTTLPRVLKVKRTLGSIGFELVHFEKDNYLFVQKDLLSGVSEASARKSRCRLLRMNCNNEKNNKYLVVKAKGGMGNRMLCAVTGILYGRLTGHCTIVDWQDAAYSNDGSNTFSRFFSCVSVYPESVLPQDGTIRPKVWQRKLHKSMSQMLDEYDPDKHSSIRIHRKYSIDVRRLDYDEDIIVFWYYTGRIKALKKHLSNGQADFAGLDTNGIIRKVLTEQMKLSDEVHQRIDEFKAKYWPEKVIGVHIRHTDRKINLAKYERHLRRFLKRFPDAHIFLATDNQQINQGYQQRFKNVFSTPKWFPKGMASMHQNTDCPDKIANGIEALVDMYLLAKCDYLIYSGHSTFSFISMILSDAQPENIVDIDRFNVKVRLKRLIRELTA